MKTFMPTADDFLKAVNAAGIEAKLERDEGLIDFNIQSMVFTWKTGSFHGVAKADYRMEDDLPGPVLIGALSFENEGKAKSRGNIDIMGGTVKEFEFAAIAFFAKTMLAAGIDVHCRAEDDKTFNILKIRIRDDIFTIFVFNKETGTSVASIAYSIHDCDQMEIESMRASFRKVNQTIKRKIRV